MPSPISIPTIMISIFLPAMSLILIMKATKVDGVYDADPATNPDAKRFESLTYNHVLTNDLGVMDSTAIALCKDNDIPILVFNLSVAGNIRRALLGETIGTIVGGSCEIR